MSIRARKPARNDASAARASDPSDTALSINGHVLDLVEGEQGVDAAWVRRRSLGLTAMVAYLLLGIAVVALGAALRVGPLGWLSGVELRLLGVETPVLSAALALGLLAVPLVWVRRHPRDVRHPTVLGAQDAFDPTRHPRFMASFARRLATARIAQRVSLAAAALAMAAGGLGWTVSQRPGPDAGKPLPILTRGQVLAAGARLPPFIRGVGGVDQRQAAWGYDHRVRQTRYRDVYIPLTDPSWRRGDPVDLLERDDLLPDDPPTERNRLDPPGAREGAVHAGVAPWLVQAMRRSGLPVAASARVLSVATDARVLEREPLHGVAPGPDWVVGLVWLDFAGATAFVAGLMAWRMGRRVAELRSAAAAADK